MTQDFTAGTPAIIYLKDGKRKYGILIENSQLMNIFQFIPNEKIRSFFTENDTSCVEYLSEETIEAIDMNLK